MVEVEVEVPCKYIDNVSKQFATIFEYFIMSTKVHVLLVKYNFSANG